MSSWLLPLAIVLAFAALLLGPLIDVVSAVVRSRTVRCPVLAGPRDVEIVERTVFGFVAAVDVAACSAFPRGATLACGKACLASAAQPQVGPGP